MVKVFHKLIKGTKNYEYDMIVTTVRDGVATIERLSSINCANTKMRMQRYQHAIDGVPLPKYAYDEALRSCVKPKVIRRPKGWDRIAA